MVTATEKTPSRNERWIALCEDLNALGQQMALPLEMTRRNNQKNLVVILYSRVLTLFQDVLAFSRRGRLTTTRPLVHALVDSTFALAAVMKDASVCKVFIREDDVQRIYRSKRNRPLPRDIGQSIRRISGRRLAERAGMGDYYLALDRMLASPSKGMAVPAYDMATGTDDTLHNRVAEPGSHGLCDVLTPASEAVFLASRLVADFYGVHNLDREFYSLWKSYHDLSKEP